MKYFIRTTGERTLDESFSQIEYELLVDEKHQPVQSMIEQLKIISKTNSVFLEDDVVLCKDFEKRINEVIKNHPNQIINFFFQPLQYQLSGLRKGREFLFNQCVYYPRYIANKIAKEMEKLLKEGFKFDQYDRLQAKAMERLGLDFYSYRPMLVQHKYTKSLLHNKWVNRGRTIYFIDDLEDLNLDYDNAKETLEYTYKKMKEINPKYVVPRVVKKS